MRGLWVALLAVASMLFSGCFGPEESEPKDESDALVGLCPQWVEGPVSVPLNLSFNGSQDSWDVVVGPGQPGNVSATYVNRSLDLVRVRVDEVVVSGGQLELTAFEVGSQRQWNLRDPTAPSGDQTTPVVVFRSGHEAAAVGYEILLSPIEHGSQPFEGDVRLHWVLRSTEGTVGGLASVEGRVSFYYRVCGALV